MQALDTPPGPPVRLEYHGRFGEVWGLSIAVGFLTLVTLGIYRFWAKTRIRGYFWSRVSANGEPLEYTGTGLELFLGFLIIAAIFIPANAVVGMAGLFFGEDATATLVLGGLPGLLVLVLIPLAVFRARRYRLSRTLWRGVRAGQTGSMWAYWGRAFGYGALGWLTLGLLRPLAQVRLTSYLMNETWFGDEKFSFHARVRDLMPSWLLVWALAAIAILGAVAAADGFLFQFERMTLIGVAPLWHATLAINGAIVAPLAAAGWLAAWIAHRVRRVRLFTAGTSVGGLSLASGIRTWRVVGIGLVFAMMIVGAILGVILLSFTFSIWGAAGFMAIALFLLIGTTFSAFVTHPLLRHYIETLEIAGEIDLDRFRQNAETAPKTGEGLAGVLDVDFG